MPKLAGNLLKFPVVDLSAKSAPQRSRLSGVPRYFSEVQELGPQGIQDLLGLTMGAIERANRLIEYMDENRDEAKMSGVETIAIELSAILEGGKLQRVEKALGESVRTGETPLISIDAFSKLRRAEFLVREADKAIDRHVQVKAVPSSMGQAVTPAPVAAPSIITSESLPLILFGVIGAGAILTVIILAITRKR
jgi:hypothetical protein